MPLTIDAATTPPESAAVACLVTSPFDRTAEDLGVPVEAGERLIAEAKATGFEAKRGQTVLVSGSGPTRWYALAGVGASPKPTEYRRATASLVRALSDRSVPSLAILGATSEERARYATEGAWLGSYAFDKYKKKDEKKAERELAYVHLVGGDETRRGARRGVDVAESVGFARDLANEPPQICNPEFLAEAARGLATRHGFDVTIFEEDELEKRGFNLIMAVGKGSASPPRLVHLVYRGEGETKRRVALVGKGVTFDSGGYSLKPSQHIENMHLDMGGAAAVLGAAEAVGRTRPAGVEIHFIVPTAENMVSGAAYRVNDIVRGYGGKTVDIRNTDAEGRLLLADALAYAQEQKPDEIIDLATLTGACVVGLGPDIAGVFSPDDAFAERFLEAAGAVDESCWRMPLPERLESKLESPFADTRNIATIRWGGAITAALFLKGFAGDGPWLHIDIAGPAMSSESWDHVNAGGTGFGVTALHHYVTAAGER